MAELDAATRLAQARELGRLRLKIGESPQSVIPTPAPELVALLDALDRVGALRDEWQADYPGSGAAWSGTPDEWWHELDRALKGER